METLSKDNESKKKFCVNFLICTLFTGFWRIYCLNFRKRESWKRFTLNTRMRWKMRINWTKKART